MKKNKLIGIASVILVFALVYACGPTAQTDYQVHRASVNMAKAYRQFQKADNAFAKNNNNSAVTHLSKGYDHFDMAMDHLAKAEDIVYNQASDEIDKGNKELQKSIDAYNNGDFDSADKYYSKALDHYDKATDLLD